MKFSTLLLSATALMLSMSAMAQETPSADVNTSKGTYTNEFEATLQVAQSQFDNWDGGENTFSGRATLRYRYLYQISKYKLDITASSRYGMNIIDGEAFKNEDEIALNLLTSWDIPNSNWAYAATFNFRSQLSDGYTSRTDNTLLSRFMAPGYFDASVGFTYSKPETGFTLILSPIAGSMTVVASDELSAQGVYGVEAGEHTLLQYGASLDARYEKKFAKDIFQYRSRLYAFTSYSDAPTMQWDNTLDIKPLDFLSISLLAKIYYDQKASVAKPKALQFNYGFSVGLAYLFKSK
ncbi:MAG: DUF3078 domain-containing protein [Rikenellaceae bacterium]